MLLFCLIIFSVHSQLQVNSNEGLTGRHPDSLWTVKHNWPGASGLIVATNMTIWGFDRYILNSSYARIDYNTIKTNLRTGFEWDNDNFTTNLFTHPVHGLLYHELARANGFNFWQSIPFTAGGSLMWELFMEKQAPSINDFMTTTMGGVCLGEMFFRITDKFIDDRTTGFDRFKREALMFILSPTREFNRIISGESWKHREFRGNQVEPVPISLSASLGYRLITGNFLRNQQVSNMFCADAGLYYGDPYDPENEKPYDFFQLRVAANLFSQQPALNRVSAIGMLFTRNIPLNRSKNQLAVGVFQHFNYYQSNAELDNISLSTYKISEAASVGPGALFKGNLTKSITLSGSAHLSAILLGGNQTDHYRYDQRDYNMGSGFSSKVGVELQVGNKVRLSLNYEDYRIYSWIGNNPIASIKLNTNVQGDKGNASLSIGRLNFNYFINKQLFLENEITYFYLKSMYDYYPTVKQSVTEEKLSVGYVF